MPSLQIGWKKWIRSVARLKTLKPLVGIMKPLVATAYAIRDTAISRNTAGWRQWYKSARWQRLRIEVLVRDQYTCQQTGVILSGRANAPDSPVVDHIKQHNGDPQLFWDPANLQAVSKAWHDSEKQRQEKRS